MAGDGIREKIFSELNQEPDTENFSIDSTCVRALTAGKKQTLMAVPMQIRFYYRHSGFRSPVPEREGDRWKGSIARNFPTIATRMPLEN